MAGEVVAIVCTLILAVLALQVTLVPADVVEHELVLVQELCRITTEETEQFRELRPAGEQWMIIAELACVIERTQLVERLEVPDAELGHFLDCRLRRFLIQLLVELRHTPPCVDAVVVEDGRRLNVGIRQVQPVDLRVFYFFLEALFLEALFLAVVFLAGAFTGVSLFFSSAN